MGDDKIYYKFYETEMWKKAFDLQKLVFDLIQTFPENENYGLISQLSRSSNSVCANLAEEHGRFHFADKIRVLYIVRGELEETQSHIIVSASRDYIPKETSTKLLNEYEKLKMILNGRIKNFNKLR